MSFRSEEDELGLVVMYSSIKRKVTSYYLKILSIIITLNLQCLLHSSFHPQVVSVRRPMAVIPSRPVLAFATILSLAQFTLCAPYGILTTAFYCPKLQRFKFKFTRPPITIYRVVVESILHTVLPTVVVIIVSRLLLLEIRRANAAREDMTGKVASGSRLSVSKAVLKLNLIFLATSIPHVVYIGLYIYSLVATASSLEAKNMIVYVADNAAVFNAGVNFLIYYTTDRRFSRAFDRLVRKTGAGSEVSGGSTKSNFSMKRVATVEAQLDSRERRESAEKQM